MNSTPTKKSFNESFKERTGIDLSTSKDINKLYYCFNKYIPLIISIFLSISFIFIAITDTEMLFNSYFIYVALITLPIMLTYIIWMPVLQISSLSNKWKIIWTIIVLVITFGLIIFVSLIYEHLSSFDITVIGFFRILLYTIFSILLIYIIYNILYEHAIDAKGILGFLLRLLLLIPQTIINIFKWVYQRLSVVNIISLTILLILILIIVCYIYSGPILNYITNVGINSSGIGNAQLLLQGPTSIYGQGAYSISNPPTLPNYTFSFWIYMNNYPTNNYEISIFKYGGGSPYITINNNTTNNMNFYPSQYFISNHQPIPFSIDSQKWNYIVVQYTANSVELYLNCSLIYSFGFDDNTMPVYVPGDNVIIGDLNIASRNVGALSNINYYSIPLTMTQMNIQYQILNLQNIPMAF
jgi:Concanavalin A-like lectin/glucanases superfamily